MKRCPTCNQKVVGEPKYMALLRLFSGGTGYRVMLTPQGMAKKAGMAGKSAYHSLRLALATKSVEPVVPGGNVYVRTPKGNAEIFKWKIAATNGNGHKTNGVKISNPKVKRKKK